MGVHGSQKDVPNEMMSSKVYKRVYRDFLSVYYREM